jgi:PAS domain S-box-containing protein
MNDKEKTKEELLQELSTMHCRIAELEESETERRHADEILSLVLKETSALTGEEFMRSLVRHLASILKIRFAIVGALIGATGDKIQTHAVWAGENFVGNFVYDLKGTPCNEVVGKTACFYPNGVQKLFPDDHMLIEMMVESYFGVPLFNSSGCPIGILIVMDNKPMGDISAIEPRLTVFASRAGAELNRKHAEEKLKNEKDYLEKLHNSLGEAVFTVKMPERVVEFVNPSVELIFGYRFEECIGQKTDIFYPEGGFADFGRKLKAAIENGDELLRTECSLRRKNGEVFPAGITMTLCRENGEVTKVISIIQDITERKRLEQDGLKAQKLESIGVLARGYSP